MYCKNEIGGAQIGKMIKIVKNTAPAQLEALKQRLIRRGLTPEQEYQKLKNPLKTIVREQLMKEQGHICAYCMRTIPDERVVGTSIPSTTIEHWIARNSKDGNDDVGTGMGVEYTNLLAVCSGGVVPRGTMPNHELTCDANRGNEPLTVNPLDEETLKSIYYKNNGEIAARDEVIENDLDKILNLNCKKYFSLPEGRKKALKDIQEYVLSITETAECVAECKDLVSAFETETDPKTPYCGAIIWWLKDYIDRLEGEDTTIQQTKMEW